MECISCVLANLTYREKAITVGLMLKPDTMITFCFDVCVCVR